ncbi:hypothetical protein VSR82_37965 [Burkholderia sp. JPY481]|uniref:hypothetical protein n=1 Tax=Paraburkholderia sp. EG304 TaxID=3237015 RepID=UPI00317027EC
MSTVLYVLTLVILITGMDVLVFRDRFRERLMANVEIVLLFAAFYRRYMKNP